MTADSAQLNSAPQNPAVTAPTQQPVKPQTGNAQTVGSTFDSDKVQQAPVQQVSVQTVTKQWNNGRITTEDSLTMGNSLQGNAAVEAYKGQILNDQDNKKISNAQLTDVVQNAKKEFESQGWTFIKKLDGDCLYIGNNFGTGQFGFGLNAQGQLFEVGQNHGFAWLGK